MKLFLNRNILRIPTRSMFRVIARTTSSVCLPSNALGPKRIISSIDFNKVQTNNSMDPFYKSRIFDLVSQRVMLKNQDQFSDFQKAIITLDS